LFKCIVLNKKSKSEEIYKCGLNKPILEYTDLLTKEDGWGGFQPFKKEFGLVTHKRLNTSGDLEK
jgi:hypothetical protein